MSKIIVAVVVATVVGFASSLIAERPASKPLAALAP